MKFSPPILWIITLGAGLFWPGLLAAPPASSAMHLSGKLNQAGAPASGEHEFRFELFTSETGDTVAPKTQPIVSTEMIVGGNWQTALDLRRFGGVKSILDNTVFPSEEAVSILDNTVIPTVGDRAILDNTVRTAVQQSWRAIEGNWLQISVRRRGSPTFVPLSPRQKLGSVPRASTAFTAEHAVVAGTVAEGGVDSLALAPGAINNIALANLAVTGPKIAPATVVRSVNGLQDAVTLAAGTGVSLSAAGNTITINSTATGGGTPLPNGNFIGANNENTFGPAVSWSVISGGARNAITKASDNDLATGVTIAGGEENSAVGFGSTVGGGYQNKALLNTATVAGGSVNEAGPVATVGGGRNNSALGLYTTVAGGRNNKVAENSEGAGIALGSDNSITNGVWAAIGGGSANVIKGGLGAMIGGGTANEVEGGHGVVVGGSLNFAGPQATVAGGSGNRAEGAGSSVGGGGGNRALYNHTAIGGGNNNIGHFSLNGTIAGGFGNTLTNAAHGFVGGGQDNHVLNGADSVVAGGAGNRAGSAYSVIIGGEGNRTEGTGGWATVLGGSFNLASGTHSIAAGHRAQATHSGSFVWNAWPGDVFASQRDYEFAVHGPGGVRFETDGAGLFVDGQRITPGGGGGGNGAITVITAGGQTEPQARLDQTNPDDYVRLMMNTPRSFWTLGTGPNGWFSFYVPGQSPANTSGDNGANRFVITANGEVGVGSQQPFAQFHVRGRGGFDLPQARLTQENPEDFARLRLETGLKFWDIAAGPDGSLRLFGNGGDRLVLGADGPQISTASGALTVNGRAVAFVDQLGQGGGGGGNGAPVSVTVAQGTAVSGVSQDAQGGVGVVAEGRVAVRATSASGQGAAIQAIQLNGSGYAGDFAGRVKVSSTLEANGGLKVGGGIHVPGLGDNTPTAAFRLVPDILPTYVVANPGGVPTLLAILDHPRLNGNPNALLMLTPVNASAYKLYQRNSDVMRGDFLTYFPDAPESPAGLRGRWALDISPTPQGGPVNQAAAVFNALVVTP